jgi:lipopolysaccharide biosynthesis protein
MTMPVRTTPSGLGGEGRGAAATPELEVAAFYLPQFHQIPENDQWWGAGFTEWTNVQQARPLYPGHVQPQIPLGGYYSLDEAESLQRQFALASRHGITAFCMYAYWFGGRRLLEKPLRHIMENPDLDVRYFLCWANESWSRVWDGGENDLLMEQRHSAEGDASIIEDLAEHLSDPRYVRIQGKPLFLIYRAELLQEPLRTVEGIRPELQPDRPTSLRLRLGGRVRAARIRRAAEHH